MQELIRVTDDGPHRAIDIKGVIDDKEAFAEAAEYMYGMFEREVFDVIICVADAGSYFADCVSKRMGKKLVCMWENKEQKEQPVTTYKTHHGERVLAAAPGSLAKGQKAIIITDVLTHGKDVEAAVRIAKSQGVEIIKIGTFVENTDFDARHKLLRGIPLECMFFCEDL